MLISDGIDYEEATHEILEEMNPNQDVVIFSYIVGQASEERSAEMKDIACQSGGDYYTFMAVGKSRDIFVGANQNFVKHITHIIWNFFTMI